MLLSVLFFDPLKHKSENEFASFLRWGVETKILLGRAI
jgi:hypothetical protein